MTAFTRSWFFDSMERAAKTSAQTLLALWGSDGLSLLTVSWIPALSVAGGAAVLSLLTSVVSAPVGEPGTASLVSTGRHAKEDDE